jgi:lipoprotein-releasing system ATP-binding protein
MQANTPEPILRCESLTKSYISGGRDLIVFSDLNLEVQTGERVAIVGESGCGKSTLLHLIGGLDRPSSGRILYKDRDLAAMKDSALAEYRNREIGFVWQIHYLLPEFTALENVMMPLLIRGEPRAKAAETSLAFLADAGLEARASHRSGELSGGEQQRVVLARALAGRPSLLLADEPTGNLDESTGTRVFDLIGSLHAKHRLTSVIVTHNLAFARRCDRVLLLEGGLLTTLQPGAAREYL